MNRYRWGLVGVAAVLAGLVALAGLTRPGPSAGAGGSGAGPSVIAAADRPPAPDFTGVGGWVNSPPLSLDSLRGRVVMVDFWTFSCVNCTRTFPHLHALVDAYGAQGLTLVGVHSPEFDFEKDPGNVRAAVARLGVTWPVALDPQMATWNAYGNQYWPAEYLLDRSGRIAYVHFGEGDYDTTAAAVAALIGTAVKTLPAQTGLPGTEETSPELYAGGAAAAEHGAERLGDGESYPPAGGAADYPASAAPARARDAIEVSGRWTDRGDSLQAVSPGHVRLRFHARDVYVVAGSVPPGGDQAGPPLAVTVTLDGSAPGAAAGPAAAGGTLTVQSSQLYQVLDAVSAGDHVIDLAVPAGFRLFTFTFG